MSTYGLSITTLAAGISHTVKIVPMIPMSTTMAEMIQANPALHHFHRGYTKSELRMKSCMSTARYHA